MNRNKRKTGVQESHKSITILKCVINGAKIKSLIKPSFRIFFFSYSYSHLQICLSEILFLMQNKMYFEYSDSEVNSMLPLLLSVSNDETDRY